jgi:GTPase SAR1 family protein
MGNDASRPNEPAYPVGNIISDETRAKEISRMDSMVRSRVRARVQHSMKIVIRGSPGTGKTSLWRRLQGMSFSPTVSYISFFDNFGKDKVDCFTFNVSTA